jgi:cellulose synthase/poly-beta-1,6-N-acetylglucosamine synthase-like glycosyltransferase
MTDIEIPYESDRHGWYRFFEILPGALSYLVLLMPLILSFISVTAAAFFILAYIIIYVTRGMAYAIRVLAGYRTMRQHEKLNWRGLVNDVQATAPSDQAIVRPKWHYENLLQLQNRSTVIKPDELYQAVIVALYKESLEVLEPTIEAIAKTDYDPKKIIVVLAYEERGGEHAAEIAHKMLAKYQTDFHHMITVKHPKDIPGEVIGKGGNITFAGRELAKYIEAEHIDPVHVVVTTLDADNRPDRQYFQALTYLYCLAPDPVRVSYQPLPVFNNNIWDVPAPMRAIATGNNFFYLVLTQRPHLERNFSAQSQSLRALIDMDFWSVRTIVEDGHQFWRSYFHYDGHYQVYPLSIPVYQDAVLAKGYIKTLKAQFVQLRRWTYGASDVAYIAYCGFLRKNKISKRDLVPKFLRAVEGHVTWAAGPLLLLLSGFVPALFHPQSYTANALPLIISHIQQIGLAALSVSLFVAVKTLPPRPARYKRHRSVLVFFQWIFLLLTPLIYGSTAALYSQTRLMFGRYLSKFDTTEKAVVTPDKQTVV